MKRRGDQGISRNRRIYIKKFCTISNFDVWIVSGQYIRKYLDKEFTNFGHRYTFNFIPRYELWIDKEGAEGEEKYFIDHMLVEYRLMLQAIEKAEKVERRERSKSKLMREIHPFKHKKAEVLKRVHQKLLKTYSKKIKVWIVSGELVRGLFFIDFTEGGHDLVYPFIPKNEIWIEDDVSQKERRFILLHELKERNLMMKGKSYDDAHISSSRIEVFCRNYPKKLDEKLKRELKKQIVR